MPRTKSPKKERKSKFSLPFFINPVSETSSIDMVPVTKGLPPDEDTDILVYDYQYGFDVLRSFIARQHIIQDQGDHMWGVWRIICWRRLI